MLKIRFDCRLSALIVLLLSVDPSVAQSLLWDNDLGPPWGGPTGRKIMPPGFPNIRVVDDVRVTGGGWIISTFVATLIEEQGWQSSGTCTVYVYAGDERPVDNGIVAEDTGPVEREFVGLHRNGLPTYYHRISLGLHLPPRTWWLGIRDADASGPPTRSAGWTTSPVGGPQESSTGYVSFQSGDAWQPEGQDWHHAFEVRGFVVGEQGPGYVREIEPVHFSGEPVGGVEEIRDGDDEYYELTADSFSRVSRAHLASVIFKTRLPVFPLQQLGLRVESTTTHTTVRQELAMFDHDADRWVVVDDRPLRSDGDMIVTLDSLDDPDRFVGDDDEQVHVRLDAYSPGTTLTRHTVKIDQVNLLVTYAPM